MPGATDAAAANAVKSVSLVSADMEMLRTCDMDVRPVVVIIVRTEKYIARITAITKDSQNQIERFMTVIIS